MNFRKASLLAAVAALVVSASLAAAQTTQKPIPKPSDRRPGELEGWSDTPKLQARQAKETKKHTAAGKTAKTEKPAEKSGDGGIPLPGNRTDPNDYAPVGFDKNGNLGTGLKF